MRSTTNGGTLDVCVGEKVDRRTAQYAKTTGRKRAVLELIGSRHNFEGFLLSMGDMIVKQ